MAEKPHRTGIFKLSHKKRMPQNDFHPFCGIRFFGGAFRFSYW
jgi:hypothetical protein